MMNLFSLDMFNIILLYQIKFNYNLNECQKIIITILNQGPNFIVYFRPQFYTYFLEPYEWPLSLPYIKYDLNVGWFIRID